MGENPQGWNAVAGAPGRGRTTSRGVCATVYISSKKNYDAIAFDARKEVCPKPEDEKTHQVSLAILKITSCTDWIEIIIYKKP